MLSLIWLARAVLIMLVVIDTMRSNNWDALGVGGQIDKRAGDIYILFAVHRWTAVPAAYIARVDQWANVG